MKKIIALAIFLAYATPAFPDKNIGIVTHVDPQLNQVTIVSEGDEPRLYFISNRIRLQINELYGAENLLPGQEVEYGFRETNTGRDLSFLVRTETVREAEAPYVQRIQQEISGELVGKRTGDRTLTLLEGGKYRKTMKVADDAIIRKGQRTIKFRELKRGNLITARYHSTEKGMFIFSSTIQDEPMLEPPAEEIAQATEVPVEQTIVAQAELPDVLPATASHYPLLALISLIAAGLALLVRSLRRS